MWSRAGLMSLAPGSELAAFPPQGPPEEIDRSGTVRDFRRAHPDFHVSPVGGTGHYAGNIAVGLGAGGRPAFVGDGFIPLQETVPAISNSPFD
jgi:hypothetical protein